jgi:uncharacterized protein GlcG (DUF336 family)
MLMSSIKVFTANNIAAESALAWVNQAFTVAQEMGINIGACVVDTSGQVKAQCMMDGVSLITPELVVRKAKTALLGLSSQDLANAIEASAVTVASMSNLQDLTLMGGGFPIISEGEVIGGFAIGGALVEQDIACAEKVMAHFA